jgi:RNA polymerase sigma-70 factor, ECF subfamily
MELRPRGNAAFACALRAWEQHHAEIRRYLVHRASDADLADDLLQDVFLKALRQGRHFCTLDNPRAWLFEVARNSLVDHVRRRKASVALPEDLAGEKDDVAPVDELAGCVERSLLRLSPEDRDVLRRCDLDGMKLQQYADVNGLTLPAVKSRIQRARRRMRETMVENCQVRFDDAGQVCCHTPREAT